MHLKRNFISKIKPTTKNLKALGLWPPSKGWREGLVWRTVSDDIIAKLDLYDSATNRKKTKNRKKRSKNKKNQSNGFYQSREWREIRVKVIEWHEGKCAMCGRSSKEHGIVIHVDHIKPRSKYPSLELKFDNLQILCEDCNLGKSNKYETDWRPDNKATDDELDSQHIISINIYR